MGFAQLAGLETDRGGSRVALQGLSTVEYAAVLADLAEQTRGELCSSPRQRTEQLMVGVLCEKRLDFFPVLIQFPLQEQ